MTTFRDYDYELLSSSAGEFVDQLIKENS